jgi:intein/homing endonuclease
LQPFDDIDGEFKARLREIATTTRPTVDNSTVTFRTARIDCEYTPKVIKRLAMGQLVAIPNVQALGANGSYSLYEIADVFPMHYSMLTLDRSQPAAIRNEFMDLIEKEWEKGSKSTWIEIIAAPLSYVMRTGNDGVTFERRAMAPLTGSQVRLLSKESIQQLICYRPPDGNIEDYSLGKLLGFTDGSIPFSVNLESLIHYMSSTFAFSLDHDETIVYRRDGKMEIGKIGEVVDRYFVDEDREGRVFTSSIEALCFDRRSMEVRWSPVQYVFRHRYPGRLLKFHTSAGRSVTVTPGHSLFALRHGIIEPVPSTELRRGDLLVGSRYIPSGNSEATCNLLDLFGSARGIGITLTGLGAEAFDVVGDDVPKRQKLRWRRSGTLPLSYWERLEPRLRESARLSYRGCKAPMPIELEVDEDVARLMGHYTAGGHVTIGQGRKYSVVFTLDKKDKGRAKDLRRILTSKFSITPEFHPHGKNGLRVTVYHRILAYFLSSHVGRGAGSKRVPRVVLNSSPPVRRAFLQAWAVGGYGVATSKGLMNDIMYMLLLDRTCAAVSGAESGGASIRGGKFNARTRYQMRLPDATELAARFTRRIDESNSYRAPPAGSSKDASSGDGHKSGKYIADTGGASSATRLLLEAGPEPRTLRQIANSDLVFYEIEDIEEMTSSGRYVYDVSVPGDENFLAGFGGIFCHNTGSGKSNLTATVIRKALKVIPDLKVVIFDVSAEYGIHILDVLNKYPSRILFTDPFKDSEDPEAEYFKRHATPETFAGREKEFYPKISELLAAGKVEFLQSRMAGHDEVAKFSTYEGLVDVLTSMLADKYGAVQQKVVIPQVIETINRFLKENDLDMETRFDSRTTELLAMVQPLLADLENRASLKKAFESLATVVKSSEEKTEAAGYTWGKLVDEILSARPDSPRVFIVNLPEAEDARLETANVINDVFRKRKRSFTLSPRVLFVIDEAQEFIPQNTRKEDGTEQSSRALERLLRHGRKYHLNCWVSTQRVAHLNTNALQQLHSYFVSTMPRPYDRQLISDTFAIDDAFMDRTLAFQNGDWLLTSFKATATQNIPVFFHASNNEEVLDSYLKQGAV